MKKTLVVTRSDAWIADRRLATGENTLEEIRVDFEVAELSIESRRILLEFGNGSYPANERLYYGNDLRPNCYANYGRIRIVVDEVAPSASQIDTALRKAYSDLADRREKEAARKAAEEKAIADARELLKDEMEKKDSRIKYLEGELAEAREKIEELETESV